MTQHQRKIVACIDNSVASRPVVDAACALARILGGSVEALHVKEDGTRVVRATAEGAGVPLCETSGDPVEQIIATASADDVAAVVLGARDLPARRSAGHVAQQLASSVDIPVLIVPPEARPPERIHRVLIAMEGTSAKARPLREAVELASAEELEIIVVHVDDEASIPRFDDKVQYETDEYVNEFLARYLPGARNATVELRVGVPADEILRTVDAVSPDLLALGWPHTDDPRRGKVAHELLDRSRVPVLLVALA